jgi:SAM-dependent methyltransferase
MAQLSDVLAGMSGGRVLDVATGAGGFVHTLAGALADYDEIVGVDSSERAAAAFAAAFADDRRIGFRMMDAAALDFAPGSFDTVCVANSLHHFADPAPVLAGMLAALKAGGRFLVYEMRRDCRTEPQLTHTLLHHWWAAVDRTEGIVHRETYARSELVALLGGLGFAELAFHDIEEAAGDPRDPALAAELAPVFDRYLARAAGRADLVAQGEALRERVAAVGFSSAPSLLAIGRK